MTDTNSEESSANDDSVSLRLKPNRQFPFHARHPWVHAHALSEQGDGLDVGQIVELLDHDGNWIARGLINPNGRLRIRLYCFDSSILINLDLWKQRIKAALARRRLTQNETSGPNQAERLIFSESDLLSGLIVDRYADCLSVQFTAAALLPWQEAILKELQQQTGCRAIRVQLDEKTAKHEGIDPIDGWYDSSVPPERNSKDLESPAESDPAEAASGSDDDDPFADPIEFEQNGLRLHVDLRSGQKTGGYLDQRQNHQVAAQYMYGREVLDVCCYQGGFGLTALAAGAKSVLAIDSSATALENARNNAIRNDIPVDSDAGIRFLRDDCFDGLKRLVEEGRQFGAVVLDPPRFAGSRHQVDAAMRAYRRLNSLALDLLSPGGILVTCSCSGRVSRQEFTLMVADVGKRRRRDLIILENRGPSPDHPVAASCPESEYLKCLICEVC